MNETVETIIEKFNAAGRFTPVPAVTPEQMRETEKELDFKFPPDYIHVLTTGSFYKANIHFIKPEIAAVDANLVIFAQWNDTQFAFHRGKQNDQGQYPVYVLVGEFVEKRFDAFKEWFAMVYDTATQPFTSE